MRTPSLGLGLQDDSGDAENGAGGNVGAGLAMADATTGLSIDMRVRTLVRGGGVSALAIAARIGALASRWPAP